MRARRERLQRHRRVVLGIGVDRDRVGLERLEGFRQAVEARNAGEGRVEIGSRGGVAGAQAHEVEAVDGLIGARMAHAHRAEPDDEHALGLAGLAVGLAQNALHWPAGNAISLSLRAPGVESAPRAD